MHEITTTARVYEPDEVIASQEPLYLWDFGGFICVGSSTHPKRLIQPYEVYGLLSNGVSPDWRDEQSYVEQTVTLYDHDYELFFPTQPDEAAAVGIDDTAYRIVGDGPSHDTDETWVLLEPADTRTDKKTVEKATLDKRLRRGSWIPLISANEDM